MAKLHNTQVFTFKGAHSGSSTTVGHNRRVEANHDTLAGYAYHLDCFLHGSAIVKASWDLLKGNLLIKVNDWGYPTSTTRSAISDFLDALGVKARVSVAGGVLSVEPLDAFTLKPRDNMMRGQDGDFVWCVRLTQLHAKPSAFVGM